ncbi:MAG: O-antigen ligase family protein [Planctomycetota bacterium]|jgi:O-antigen ligase
MRNINMTMHNIVSNKLYLLLLVLLAFWLPLSISLSQTFYVLAFAVWLTKMVVSKKPFRYTKMEIPIIVFAIVYIAAVLFSPSPSESVGILKKPILVGLFLVLTNSLDSEIEKRRLIDVWLLGAIIASAWTIIDYFRGIPRPGGLFGCITFGHFALLFLGVSLSLMGLKNYKRTSILSVLTFIVGVPALFLTFTRGAWIGFIVGLALFFIIKRKWFFLATSTVTLILIVSVLFTCFPNSGPGKAVTSLLQPFDNQVPRVAVSNLRHLHKWKASWKMFTEHPLFGVGPQRFQKELPNYLSEEVKAKIFNHRSFGHAHSIFFFFTVFRLLISKYKSCDSTFDKSLVLGVLIAVISFCIGGLTHQSSHDSEILLNLCFLLGLVL